MADKKIVYAEPDAYFPPEILEKVEQELKNARKSAAEKAAKNPKKTAKK